MGGKLQVILIATIFLLNEVALSSRIQDSNTENKWDVLIFTQSWPNTVCMKWRNRGNDTCGLPRRKDHWVIHGIWPNKTGEFGPHYCRSITFDVSVLEVIKDKLEEFWPDIEVGGGHRPYGFWNHEWSKHGTCVSDTINLDSVLKYFMQGLKWNKDYNIAEILETNSIYPNNVTDGYGAEEISDAVSDATGKNPIIKCFYDRRSGLPFLHEISICFNRDLDLIDCDAAPTERKFSRLTDRSVLTNCPLDRPIVYPKNISSSR